MIGEENPVLRADATMMIKAHMDSSGAFREAHQINNSSWLFLETLLPMWDDIVVAGSEACWGEMTLRPLIENMLWNDLLSRCRALVSCC